MFILCYSAQRSQLLHSQHGWQTSSVKIEIRVYSTAANVIVIDGEFQSTTSYFIMIGILKVQKFIRTEVAAKYLFGNLGHSTGNEGILIIFFLCELNCFHWINLGLQHGARFLCEVRVPYFAYVGAGNSTSKRDSYSVNFLDRTGTLNASNDPADALKGGVNAASDSVFQVRIFIPMHLPESQSL